MFLPIRIVRGGSLRLIRLTRMIAFCAPVGNLTPSVPEGCTLFRADLSTAASSQKLIENAMWAAGEDPGLVVPRLVHGDVFFGWLAGDQIVSFGWVMYYDRSIGPVPLREAPGRVFLYNFQTLKKYRCRGFCSALLLNIRQMLGREGVTKFIIDTQVGNTPSVKALAKTGFSPVARFSFLTVFNRWQRLLKLTVFGDTMKDLPMLFSDKRDWQDKGQQRTA